ncbi:DNA primase [Merismopedia glauca]|uniref:DNA primase n=1 Tax=Merismopedia glauca CCAP 1448/3 TaxID=1296344 RepID=A0A2T1C9A2_9CYAN|nr:DNA primase [Merismopedia glauca]PSB04821.1 DNA primase [Merismopedia glauca CCAP 1448/3]
MSITRLHPETIEQVKQRVDIVDVVSEHVVLKKRGKDYLGLCPFHGEKSPSFSVSPTKQMYYCFGCQAGGNAINFLMEIGKQSFAEVVVDLAKRYQVPIQALDPQEGQELQRKLSQRELLYEIVALASKFYEHALQQPQGAVAFTYLRQERRLSPETIQKFQLGYAPAGWDTLYRYLIEQKRYSVQLVEQAGLIIPRQSGSGYYDRFRDRLMVPIHDNQGRVIGFGGRTLTDEQPKYLNSPETDLFDKGKTLFALDRAKNAISQQDRAVVVEGYFDAIALHAAGIECVVACLGTALSLAQMRQLVRYTESKQIILNFDADRAGNTAAARAISEVADLANRGEIMLRVLNLPDGKDADEFLKSRLEGKVEYEQLLTTAPLWIDWQISRIVSDRQLSQADEFQQVSQQLVKLLSQITDSNTRTHYLQHCAQLLSQGEVRVVPLLLENLQTQVKRLMRSRSGTLWAGFPQSVAPISLIKTESPGYLSKIAEELLLRLYFHSPEQRQEIVNGIEARRLLDNLHHELLWGKLLNFPTNFTDKRDANALFSWLQEETKAYPQILENIAHLWYLDEKAEQEMQRGALVVRAAIATLEMVKCEQQKRYCLQKWLASDTPESTKEFYYQQFYSVQQRIAQLEAERQFDLSDLTQVF